MYAKYTSNGIKTLFGMFRLVRGIVLIMMTIMIVILILILNLSLSIFYLFLAYALFVCPPQNLFERVKESYW